jgi:cytohesin
VAEVLIAAGADVNAQDKFGATPLDEALRYRNTAVVNLLIQRTGGKLDATRQLQDAVMRGQLDMVTLLLGVGADPNAKTANGSTLLHDAALKGHREIVQLLLARGARADSRNAGGATPLHDASLGGHIGVIELLLDRGAEIDARDTEAGATPLHHAASWGRCDAVRVLIKRGADRSARNKAGKTAAEVAEGCAEQVRAQ